MASRGHKLSDYVALYDSNLCDTGGRMIGSTIVPITTSQLVTPEVTEWVLMGLLGVASFLVGVVWYLLTKENKR